MARAKPTLPPEPPARLRPRARRTRPGPATATPAGAWHRTSGHPRPRPARPAEPDGYSGFSMFLHCREIQDRSHNTQSRAQATCYGEAIPDPASGRRAQAAYPAARPGERPDPPGNGGGLVDSWQRWQRWPWPGKKTAAAGGGQGSTLASGRGQPLPRVDWHVDGVLGGRQRAHPARVVPARRVVHEIEVDDDALAVGSEIGALRGVEQIAATAITGAAGCRVPDRQEEAATVLVQPPQRQPPADRGGDRDPPAQLKAGDAVRAGVDLEPLGLRGRFDGHREAQRRIVGPVRHAADPQRVTCW